MTTLEPTLTFDFRKTQNKNRLKGLWQMMEDYRLPYLGATLALAGAALAKTFTYLLLAYFAYDVITQGQYIDGNMTRTFLYIGLGFVVLALFEGGFSFLSGRLAAYTAEGITRRLRDFLFDHIQRLSFSYHATTPTGDLIERVTSDVDSVRRFFSEQASGMGRLSRRDRGAFRGNRRVHREPSALVPPRFHLLGAGEDGRGGDAEPGRAPRAFPSQRTSAGAGPAEAGRVQRGVRRGHEGRALRAQAPGVSFRGSPRTTSGSP